MGTRDPEWLQGQTTSDCRALVWSNVSERQFCVLPSYPDGNRMAKPHYAMYGRALSDGEFYPIPPSMYLLRVVHGGPCAIAGYRESYRWEARAHGHDAYEVPIEMQTVGAVQIGSDSGGAVWDLEVSGVVAPEFVSREWATNGHEPTVFYPDAKLWYPFLCRNMAGVYESPETQLVLPRWRLPRGYSTAPVVTEFDHILRQVTVRGASSRLWARPAGTY